MTDETNVEPKWFIDDGIPGQGERPDWLHDRFKSVAELGKSYTELEKRFSAVPEEYDFSKSRYLDPDYQGIKELRDLARERRVPNVVIDKMISTIDSFMDESIPDPKKEMEKLGDNAKERIAIVDNWAKANLTKESYEALSYSLKSADAIKALEELRGKSMSSNPSIPSGNDNASHGGATLEDIKAELSNNLEKYKKDPKYQKDIQQRLEVAAKNTPGFVDKVGA